MKTPWFMIVARGIGNTGIGIFPAPHGTYSRVNQPATQEVEVVYHSMSPRPRVVENIGTFKTEAEVDEAIEVHNRRNGTALAGFIGIQDYGLFHDALSTYLLAYRPGDGEPQARKNHFEQVAAAFRRWFYKPSS